MASSARLRATLLIIGCSLAALAGCLFLYHHDPHAAGMAVPCPFHALTGLDCPSCGSTRALYHMLHGQWAEAIAHNLFIVISWPLAAVIIYLSAARPRRVPSKVVWWLAYIYVALLIAWWIARNLI